MAVFDISVALIHIAVQQPHVGQYNRRERWLVTSVACYLLDHLSYLLPLLCWFLTAGFALIASQSSAGDDVPSLCSASRASLE